MFAHLSLHRRTFVVLLAVVSLSVIPVTRTYAADNCQHFTHSHYHFPYAHYDEYLYQGHGLIGGSHYNYYHNTYHGDFIQKFCPGQ